MPAVAAFVIAAIAADESLVITVPDDALLPELSNAIELELRPLCLILPQPDFAARVALRATLALLKSRISRAGDSRWFAAWEAQRQRLDTHAGIWTAALAWAASNGADDCPVDVSMLFPVCILPAARTTPASDPRNVSLVINAERMPDVLQQLTLRGARSLLLYGSRTALVPVAEHDLLNAELELLAQQVGEMELELATTQAELAEFTRQYYDRVAMLVSELDALEADIARRLAAQRPTDRAIREDAEQAARTAEQSQQEAHRFREVEQRSERPFMPSGALKRLFRQLAQKIHPDRAANEGERAFRTELMSEANRAYRNNDEMTLQGILDQWLQRDSEAERSSQEDAQRTLADQVTKMQRRLAQIEGELDRLFGSRLYELFMAADVAQKRGRNLIDEMAGTLENKIKDARLRIADLEP